MELKIDHESSIPLHAQVETLLRGLIEKTEYQKGALLPKEVDLAMRLGISRNTVRQASNKLVNEGLLIRKKGVGTRVAEKTVNTNLQSWHSFTQEMNDQGVVFKNYSVEIKQTKVDKTIAAFMGIDEDTKVLCLKRTRGLEDGPIVYFKSYFHPRIGLTGNENFNQPLYELLENSFSTVVSVSKEKISAELASTRTADRLEIKPKDAVLKRERFVSDPGGRPVEYNVGYYRADKFTYTIDIKR